MDARLLLLLLLMMMMIMMMISHWAHSGSEAHCTCVGRGHRPTWLLTLNNIQYLEV